MLDQQNAHAAGANAANDFHQARHLHGIHPCRRLVEQQDPGPHGQRARNLQPLLLAIGERLCGPMHPLAEREPLDAILRLAAKAALRPGIDCAEMRKECLAMDGLANAHVVQHRLSLEQPQVLKRTRKTGLHDGFRLGCGDIHAIQHHRARRCLVDAREQVDGGGLARTVGADQAENLAGAKREIEVGERLHAAECLPEFVHLQQGAQGLLPWGAIPGLLRRQRRAIAGPMPSMPRGNATAIASTMMPYSTIR